MALRVRTISAILFYFDWTIPLSIFIWKACSKFSHLFQLQHILSQLGSLSAGWMLEENSFVSSTPKGKVTFTNVLAVLDPSAPRRLLLACHHDSKILPADLKNPKRVFVGASDSAIPCAMILELATALDTQLTALKLQVDHNHEEKSSSRCFSAERAESSLKCVYTIMSQIDGVGVA